MVPFYLLSFILILNSLTSLQASSTNADEEVTSKHKSITSAIPGITNWVTEAAPSVNTKATNLNSTQYDHHTVKSENGKETGVTKTEDQKTTFNIIYTEYDDTVTNKPIEVNVNSTKIEGNEDTIDSSTLKSDPKNDTLSENSSTDEPLKINNILIPNVKNIVSQIDNRINDVTNILKGDITSKDVAKVVKELDILNILNNGNSGNPNDTELQESAESLFSNGVNLITKINKQSKKITNKFKSILGSNDHTNQNSNMTKRNINYDKISHNSEEEQDTHKEDTKLDESIERIDIHNDKEHNTAGTTKQASSVCLHCDKKLKQNKSDNVLTIINTGKIQDVDASITLKGHNYIFQNKSVESGVHLISKIKNENVADTVANMIVKSFKKKADLGNIFGKKGKKKLIKSIIKSITDSMIVIINTGTINGLTLNLPGPDNCANSPPPHSTTESTSENVNDEKTTNNPNDNATENTTDNPKLQETSVNPDEKITKKNIDTETTSQNPDTEEITKENLNIHINYNNSTTEITRQHAHSSINNLSDEETTEENLNNKPVTIVCHCDPVRTNKIVKRDLELKNLEIPILGTIKSASDGDNIKGIIEYLKQFLSQGASQAPKRRTNFEDASVLETKF